ncbi:MAG TPA: GDP-mannose 4,6-dehydratase [Gemmatimonadaceae bacterium]
MKILVTGGCGFIGRNSAERFLRLGHSVSVLDDLSRPGGTYNLQQLRQQRGFEFHKGDIRDQTLLKNIIRQGNFDAVLHLAGQVAVTTSMLDPRHDFDVNALGAVNLLDTVRQHSPETIVLNASTNKVYGDLHSIGYREEERRYTLPGLSDGVSENQPVDFHSPYGCSKGAADHYMIDFARCYGLRTVTFRQSCIYGYWQFGIEDQGWVAWFVIAHLLGRPITIFGNGKQVRDVLFIDDLVDVYVSAMENIDNVAGQAINIGGGPSNTLSLLEFIDVLENLSGRPVEYDFADARPGDQPVYISNIERASKLLGWSPKVSAVDGVGRLYRWVEQNIDLFQSAKPTVAAVG